MQWFYHSLTLGLASLLGAQPLPVSSPADLGLSAKALEKIAPVVESMIAEEKLVGGSVLVLRRGEIAYQKAFGFRDREEGLPMQADTVFRIYSMTKAMTSALALMLCEEGRMSLDDPINLHLDGFTNLTVFSGGAARRIPTVRDLLRHTSGFATPWGAGEMTKKYQAGGVMDRSLPLAELPVKLAPFPLLDQPGVVWRYGLSSDLLAALLSKVAQKPFEQLMQERLIQPLKMKETSYQVRPDQVARFAQIYQGRKGKLVAKAGESPFLKNRPFKGGGTGLVSTITDYARFLQMIANGGEFQGQRYLREDSVDLMRTNQLPRSISCISFGKEERHGTGFGLGFCVRFADDQRWDSDATVGEYGWGGLASTHYWISPKHELVVVTMEQTLPYNWNLEHALKPLIYEAVLK